MSEPSPIVLVIDDEVQIRRFLRTGFELNGFVVHEAGTGAEAIRSATLRPIDLVIVDLGLPDMDGSEVVERADHRAVGALKRSAEGASARTRR
jgi:two-component system KDP operon response regulator KdpE